MERREENFELATPKTKARKAGWFRFGRSKKKEGILEKVHEFPINTPKQRNYKKMTVVESISQEDEENEVIDHPIKKDESFEVEYGQQTVHEFRSTKVNSEPANLQSSIEDKLPSICGSDLEETISLLIDDASKESRAENQPDPDIGDDAVDENEGIELENARSIINSESDSNSESQNTESHSDLGPQNEMPHNVSNNTPPSLQNSKFTEDDTVDSDSYVSSHSSSASETADTDSQTTPGKNNKTVIIQFQEPRSTKVFSEMVEVKPTTTSTENSDESYESQQ